MNQRKTKQKYRFWCYLRTQWFFCSYRSRCDFVDHFGFGLTGRRSGYFFQVVTCVCTLCDREISCFSHFSLCSRNRIAKWLMTSVTLLPLSGCISMIVYVAHVPKLQKKIFFFSRKKHGTKFVLRRHVRCVSLRDESDRIRDRKNKQTSILCDAS